MSTPTTDRAAIVLQQIDARIAAIAGNWPDESRALRCLKTAIEWMIDDMSCPDEATKEFYAQRLTTLCDQWQAAK
jgi:hypothetical protein